MLVKQIYIDNPYRNFNYLIVCKETGETLAVDPLDADGCYEQAKQAGFEITQILNTHEHWDHIGGNQALVAKTKAKILAHSAAKNNIPDMSRGLNAGDVIKVGNTVELEVLDTPGHTLSHVCVLSQTETPALFCGDTLFNAGAGNCHNGGDPHTLFNTFDQQLAGLAENTLIYPGHDYITNNLKFTLNREPSNEKAQQLLQQVSNQDPHTPLVTTLALEKEINTFFRLLNPSVIEQLREQFPKLSANPSEEEVFLCLRQLRNSW